ARRAGAASARERLQIRPPHRPAHPARGHLRPRRRRLAPGGSRQHRTLARHPVRRFAWHRPLQPSPSARAAFAGPRPRGACRARGSRRRHGHLAARHAAPRPKGDRRMTPPLRALVIDDERLAPKRLRELLAKHPEIEVVGEADDLDSAQAAAEALRPDLLFLDVDLSPGNGFELLPRLSLQPATVFVTAYDEFAVQAFDVTAFDYLLK